MQKSGINHQDLGHLTFLNVADDFASPPAMCQYHVFLSHQKMATKLFDTQEEKGG